MAVVSEISPVDAGLLLPVINAEPHFDVVSAYVEAKLTELGATAEIIDPTVKLLERPWNAENPEDAAANRTMIMQAVSSGPDSQAAREAICKVTGANIPPLHVAVMDILQDIGKPAELSRQSQAGGPWYQSKREAMTIHVSRGRKIVELSDLPDFFEGTPFKAPVAIAIGEHHENQPPPSLEYGCGAELDLLTRPLRDSVSPSDWFGAKFYRDNDGNRDEFGNPLSDEVRSVQFYNYLNYFFSNYWYVSEKNNAGQVVNAVYEGIRANHPSRVADLNTVASVGSATLRLVA